MSKCSPYAEETRQQVTKSTVNRSTAKTLWSFSKEKRFQDKKPQCPYVSYDFDLSTNSKRNTQFGSAQRRVFTETSDNPTSWVYNINSEKQEPTPIFGLSRDKCVASSYIPLELLGNPGPGRYTQVSQHKHGFSMRPKTAYNRIYFIDNKEQKSIPSPFEYTIRNERQGKSALSKYRSVTLGSVGLQTKNNRFLDFSQHNPSPVAYHPIKYGINKKSKGGAIGKCKRQSFIDDISYTAFTPAPGDYKSPTEFAHYKKSRNSFV